MKLTFQVREDDLLAFNERYLVHSSTHQKARTRVRCILPAFMLGLIVFNCSTQGFSFGSVVPYALIGALWFFYYPLRFDANVRNHVKKQLKEPSHAKMLGSYELTLTESSLESVSPLGSGSYPWSVVERAELSDQYLFIYLSGPLGYPVPRSDIGPVLTDEAYAFIQSHICRARGDEDSLGGN